MPRRRRRASSSIGPSFTSLDKIPLICYSPEIARLIRKPVPAVWRLIRAGDFSRFPPPRGTNPYTWLKADILAYFHQPKLNLQPSGLRPVRRRQA